MKKKILKMGVSIGLVTILLMSSFLTGASVVNTALVSANDNDKEEYYAYGASWTGKHFESGNGHTIVSSNTPPLDVAEAAFTIDIGCSDQGVKNNDDDFEIGVYYSDDSILTDGPDLYLYNYNENKFVRRKQSMGKPGSSFKWKWYSINEDNIGDPNDYISSSDKVKIKIVAVYGDVTTIDSVCVRYIDEEESDQCKTDDSSFGGEYKFIAQSFIPTFKKLTRVKVLMKNNGYVPNSLRLNILQSLKDPYMPLQSLSIYSINFPCDTNGLYRWVEADVKDVELIPGETYYIGIDLRLNTNSLAYSNNQYASGSYHLDDGGDPFNADDWGKTMRTYCFKTYGEESCDLNSELKVSTNTINFGTVQNSDVSPKMFNIKNDGDKGSALQWTASDNKNWISLDKTSGVVYKPHSGEAQNNIYVTIDVSKLEGDKDGIDHKGTITVTANGATEEITVEVTVVKSRSSNTGHSNILQMLMDHFPAITKLLNLSIF